MLRSSLCLLALALSLRAAAATRAVFDNDGVLPLGEGSVMGLRAVDMTGDAKPDIVALVAHHTGPRLYVFPSQGDGTFAAPRITTLPPTSPPMEVAFDVADVNGDGKPDVAFAYEANDVPRIAILHGVGDGTFTSGALLSPSGCRSTIVELADLTNDGRPEVLTCSLSVFLNLGSGTFGSQIVTNTGRQYAINVGNANGDAFPDVFLQDSSPVTYMLPGNGNGTFGPAATIDAHGITSAVADFDGNGRSDVAFLDYWKNDLAAFLATPSGAYPTRVSAGFLTTRSSTPLATADMNADGRPDILAAAGGLVSISLTTVSGTPGPPASYVTAGGWGSVAAADFDADGAMDVITGGSLPDRAIVAFMRGAAGGTLRAPRAHVFSREGDFGRLEGGRPVGAAIADVTGDGKLDAISLVAERQTLTVLPGNGDGTTGTRIETFVQHAPNTTLYSTSPVFADFDGNGVLDVALVASSAYWVDCWLANGDGTFRRAATTDMPGVFEWARTGDFDGDGHQDLAYSWEGTLRFYPGNGDGTFAPVVTPAVPFTDRAFLAGDVNGDGKDDIVGNDVVLLGSASRAFTRIEQSSGADLDPAALTDLNDDGHLDFVQTSDWWFDDPIEIRVRLGAGDGTFGAPRRFFANVYGPAVPGDYNADGNADLLFGAVALLGDGEGSFDGHARLRRDSTFGLSVAAGDLDGNGSSDILYANLEEHAMELVRTWTEDSREMPVTIAIGTVAPSVEAGDKTDVPVTATHGTFLPSSAVVFSIGDDAVSFVELEDGAATGVILHETIGAKTIHARFAGDDVYAAAAATPVAQEVTRAMPGLWLFTVPVYPRVREDVHIRGTFTSGTTAAPTGTVTVFVDGVEHGTGSAPTFDIAVGALPAGNRTVTVQYSGDALHLPYLNHYTITVNKLPPAMTFTVSPSGSANYGTPVTLTVTFADPTTTGEARWVVGQNGNYKETATSAISGGTASFTTSALPVGSVDLGVYFPGNAEYVAGSQWESLNVVDVPVPPSASSLYLITPCRILDTRGAVGAWGGPWIASNTTRSIQITGKCGIPAGAKAVAVNVTAVAPVSTGFLALFPGASTHPGNSTLNYRAGRTRANNTVMPLSAAGILKVYNTGPDPTHVLLDLTAYFR